MTRQAAADAFWHGLRALADAPAARPREPLWLGAPGEVIGSIEPGLAQRMAAAGLPIAAAALPNVAGGAGWCVATCGAAPADATLACIARWLQAEGVVSRWRDELLTVTDSHGMPRGRIERAAVRPLGIATRAVHLIGVTPDDRVWVQQRAHDKATDPGRWDTLMGGLQVAGEADLATLERETWEEAGLRLTDLQYLRATGHLTVRRPVAEGYLVEHTQIFAAIVPSHLVPVNHDCEVVRFECLNAQTLAARLAQGAFTLEAALILGQFTGFVPTR